uniref:Uncharacterized protein n=1 Tax=Eutreptiella gymnastica TaxID=73025 RepID=A0A7S4LF76_9EUGL
MPTNNPLSVIKAEASLAITGSRLHIRDEDPSNTCTISSFSNSCSRSISVTSFYSVSSGCSEGPQVVVEHPEASAGYSASPKLLQQQQHHHQQQQQQQQQKQQQQPQCFLEQQTENQIWKLRRRITQEEKLSRKMLAEMEAREFWSIQLLEEEHFTKLPVLVIERAWCAYKTRCIINEIIRRRSQYRVHRAKHKTKTHHPPGP